MTARPHIPAVGEKRGFGRLTARIALAAAACLLAAACATPPEESPPSAEAPAAEEAVAATDADSAPPLDESTEEDFAVDVPAEEVEPVEEEVDELAAVPPEIPREPDKLVGLSEADLMSYLGAPSFLRRDGPAQIWQYRNEVCVLDLFLYSSGSGSPTKVTHIETRSRTVVPTAAERCYHDLLKARFDSDSG